MNRTLLRIHLVSDLRYLRHYGSSSFTLFRPVENFRHCGLIPSKYLQRRGQFKCVYQQMGYEAPLSPDDRRIVLDKLNNLPPEDLSRFLSKSKSEVLISQRPFEVVEQLLDLKGFNLKLVEDLFLKLLAFHNEENSLVKTPKKVNAIRDQLKHIKPRVSKAWYDQNVQSLLAVSFNLHSLSYAQMTKERKVLTWSSLTAFDSISSRSSFDHQKVYQLAKNIVEKLPQSDVYVWEELPAVMPRDPYISNKLNTLVFQAYLVSLINSLNASQENRVHLIKISLVDTIFNLRVGLERTSVQKCLQNIFNFKSESDFRNSFAAVIDAATWERYHQMDKSKREQMSTAMLLALAFNHLYTSETLITIPLSE